MARGVGHAGFGPEVVAVGLAPPPASAIRGAWLAWAACIVFTVYGSLVPFDWTPLPWDEAWARFRRMPVLEIGAEHRADWIANIVLYLPVGFLSVHALLRTLPRQPREPLLLAATAFSWALAVAVEFAQIFFPPRTVALNDICAEAVGSLAGVALATRTSEVFATLLATGPLRVLRIDPRWLGVYAAGYIAFSLFPYDLVLSADELALKAAGPDWGWLAVHPVRGRAVALLKLASEMLLTAPIGWWWCANRSKPLSPAGAFGRGAALGLAIEVGQFFLLSGSSQGLSVVSRGLGALLGAQAWARRMTWRSLPAQALLRRHLLWLVPLHVLAILQVNHWFTRAWTPTAAAAAKWADVPLMPFYFYYWTTEVQALASLAAVSLLYAPIGLWTWALRGSGRRAAVVALAACAVAETGRLWIPHAHPDPTDPLIAAVAAWAAAALIEALARGATLRHAAGPVPTPTPPTATAPATDERSAVASAPLSRHDDPPSAHRAATPPSPGLALRTGAWLIVLASVARFVTGFPLVPPLIAALLAAAGLAVWRRPARAFAIGAAALPLFDLAPWSGRVVVDEFDALLAVCLATAALRTRPAPRSPSLDGWWRAAVGLAVLALVANLVHAVFPWRDASVAMLEPLRGPLDTLRVAKGAVWALIGAWVWRRVTASDDDAWPLLVRGIVAGLAGTVGVVLWERATFASVLDFADHFRVTGPFAAMHVGGAYVEAYLVVGAPFLVALTLGARHALSRFIGAALAGATAYAIAVTFSRSGAAGALVAATVLLLAGLVRRRRAAPKRFGWGIGLIAVAAALAAPAASGPFMQARLATVDGDFAARRAHWNIALAARADDGPTRLAGAGAGRFAENYYWSRTPAERSGSYGVRFDEHDAAFLRLGGGSSLYVEQFVALHPDREYRVSLDIRSNTAGTDTLVAICEKALLDSFECASHRRLVAATAGGWQHLDYRIESGSIGGGPWFAARPVKLSIRTPAPERTIDVRAVSLREKRADGRGGTELIANGSFERGMDHWYYSADDHLPWHAKSLPIAIWFEWGWLGVAGFGALCAVAAVRGAQAAFLSRPGLAGGTANAAALAALAGFLTIGLVDSLIDTPRFLLVALVLCGLCVACRPAGGARPDRKEYAGDQPV